MSNTVAVAQSTPTPSSDTSSTTESQSPPEMFSSHSTDDNMPLEIYEREKHHDFAIEALDINEDPNTLPWKMNERVKNISKYIKSEIGSKGLEATTDSYKQVIKGIKKDLGIDKNADPDIAMERIEGYIDSLKTLNSLKEIADKPFLNELKNAKSRDEMERLVMEKVEKYIK